MNHIHQIENALPIKQAILLRIIPILSFVILLAGSHPATAARVTWSLDNVTFSDGGIATGSFVADASGQTMQDFNISVSGGDELTFPAFTYTRSTAPGTQSGFSGPLSEWLFVIDGLASGGTPESRLFLIFFEHPLTDVGGTVALKLTESNRECFNCSPFRLIVSGSVTAVPVPAAVWLFNSGLAGLLVFKRRYAKSA